MSRRIRIIRGEEAIKAHMDKKYNKIFFMARLDKVFLYQTRELIFDRDNNLLIKYNFKYSFSAS